MTLTKMKVTMIRSGMNKSFTTEPCPRCRKKGRDTRGDNLIVYSDGGAHCFSCSYHRHPKFTLNHLTQEVKDDNEKAVLPSDFTREIPAECWKWLLQYGLPYSYWKAYCGYSPKANRLILTFGTPIKFSIGRAFTVGDRKWKFYGDGHKHTEVFSEQLSKEVVLVEDLISAHKVAQVTSCVCLFGVEINDLVIKQLKALKRPVTLWLDDDQYSLLPKKINRLQSLLDWPVRYVHTPKDPKAYTTQEIREILM